MKFPTHELNAHLFVMSPIQMIALALTEKTRYHLSHMTRQDLRSHQCNPPQGRSLTEQDPFGSASTCCERTLLDSPYRYR